MLNIYCLKLESLKIKIVLFFGKKRMKDFLVYLMFNYLEGENGKLEKMSKDNLKEMKVKLLMMIYLY